MPACAASDGEDLPDEAAALSAQALEVLRQLDLCKWTVGTAESCTGGLLASLLTDQDGFGRCFDRAFVNYTDCSKVELLGVDLIDS